MRRLRLAAIGAMVGLCTLVACGRSGPTGPGAGATTPGSAAAKRYEVLTANPVCTPTTGCTAVAGFGTYEQGGAVNSLCFTVLDNGAADDGRINFWIDQVGYDVPVSSVEATATGITITASVTDASSTTHPVTVVWGTGSGSGVVRTITIDGTPHTITFDSQSTSIACQLIQQSCAF